MSKLESMNRLANKEAKKLGIDVTLTVVWKADCPVRSSRWNRYTTAHAHCYPPPSVAYGTICVRRGLRDWRSTIKHEVAHFVPKGYGHGNLAFLEARAKQGSKVAARYLIQKGKRRCPRHNWMRGRVISEKATGKGLLVLYESRCINCGKSLG